MAKDYEQELAEALKGARKRLSTARQLKSLKSSAPALFEIIDGEISMLMNRVLNREDPLPYDEYQSAHGEMKALKRIRDLANSKTAEEVQLAGEVKAISDNLKNVRDAKKQQ